MLPITNNDIIVMAFDWLSVPTTANQIINIDQPKKKNPDFFPTTSLKTSRGARIDQLADSNEPAKKRHEIERIWTQGTRPLHMV